MSTAYDRPPSAGDQKVGEAVQRAAEQAQLLVREEIELAKAELREKVNKLVKGAVVGAVALVFVLGALIVLLHGFSWLAWFFMPFGNEQTYFWGFFFVALVLLILAAVAGLLAKRWITKATPPKPELALEEAQRIKATISSDDDPTRRAEVTPR